MSRRMAADDTERTYEYKDRTLLWRMVRYLFAYKKLFFATAVCVTINIIIGVVSPFLLQHAIDVDFPSGDMQSLLLTTSIYIVLQFIGWGSVFGSSYLTTVMGQDAVYEIRQDLYHKLQNMSQDFYDKSSSGRVISRITNDIDRMSDLLSGGLIDTFAQVFIVGAIGAVIFTVDTQLALASLSVVPILLVTTIYFRRKLREAYRSTRKTISSVTSNLAESISGAKVTKTFAREQISVEVFDELNQDDYKSNIDAGKAQASFFPTIRLISGLGIVLILWIGGMRLIAGTLTLGTLVLFMQFNSSFFRPILIISNFYTSVQSAFAGAERVFTILDSESSVQDRPGAIDMPAIRGHIVYDDVDFGYIEGVPVLQDFNLEIMPGETIALVGDTGAGKTTVVNLLNRFYDVDSGSIEIDSIDIRNVTQESLHTRLGLVLQDPFLFNTTVRENIRYGKPDATDEEIMQATAAIGAKRIFENLDKGFDTVVGERGNRLSEGERQLVSFARALLADPKILVLDEATSSVDIYTEHAIQKGMKALLSNRTSIVIAHRLSTIVSADRILVLEQGKIVEQGKHAELMRKQGKYYSLYELQLKPHAMSSSSSTPT